MWQGRAGFYGMPVTVGCITEVVGNIGTLIHEIRGSLQDLFTQTLNHTYDSVLLPF